MRMQSWIQLIFGGARTLAQLHAVNAVLFEKAFQLGVVLREDPLHFIQVHCVLLSEHLEARAGPTKVQTAVVLAVELAVIDVERQRLSKGSFNVRLELLHLFSNLNWVLVKDKLHQVSVLKDKYFDEGEVPLAWVG